MALNVHKKKHSITVKEFEKGLLKRATDYENQKMNNLYKITKEVIFSNKKTRKKSNLKKVLPLFQKSTQIIHSNKHMKKNSLYEWTKM